VLVLVGPTGIGKTRAAFDLARRHGAEIVVADSRQAYARLHIATNHPPDDYRAQVRYHGIDFADPVHQVVDVHDFLVVATAAIADAQDRGVPVVVEGGSMLWVDALTEGYDLARAEPDPMRRSELRGMGVGELAALVRRLDPGAEVDYRNPPRLVRAVEILEAHGPPLAARRRQHAPPWRFLRAGIEAPMAVIERRLRARCAEQVARGLVAETRAALDAGVPRDHPVLTGIGYAQALELMEGHITEAELPVRMLQANRRYAKRQLAWFKRYQATRWFEAEPDPAPGILSYLETAT
jgi:tRNA dimethylallyltransferase